MKKLAAFHAAVPVFVGTMAVAQAPQNPIAAQSPGRTIGEAQLTSDGVWLVYRENPASDQDLPVIVTRSTRDATERRYPAEGPFKLADSGRWLALVSASQLQLVELKTGNVKTLASVPEFEFAPSGEWLAWRTGNGLRLMNLASARQTEVDGVAMYAFDPHGRRVALATENTLSIRDLETGRTLLVDQRPAAVEYGSLTWSSSGRGLAALRREEGKYAILVSNQGRTRTFSAERWKTFPKGYEICARPSVSVFLAPRVVLVWRDNESGIFFPLCRQAVARASAPGEPQIWHWAADALPAETAWRSLPQYLKPYLAFVSLENDEFLQLADTSLPDVMPQGRGRHVLGYDWRRYGWQNARADPRGTQLRDYSLVDLKTGIRTRIAEGLPVPPGISGNRETNYAEPQLSPNGAFAIYPRNGDYFSYEVASGAVRNLTAGLPAKFYFRENSPETGHFFKRAANSFPTLQGWTRDGRSVLLSDNYDVWLLALDGTSSRNLTGNGSRDRLNYGRALFAEGLDLGTIPADAPVDLRQPMYFAAREIATRRMHLVRRSAEGSMETLRLDEAYTYYARAASADVQLLYRGTAIEPMDFFLVDSSWKTARRLTDVDPSRRGNPALRAPIHLTYSTPNGVELHGVLFLPVDAVPSRRYPTIVNLYEDSMSSILHTYLPFGKEAAGELAIAHWLERGYAVLWADIIPRVGEPGPAALEAITAAIVAGEATGYLDREHLGLIGHSYGGYETNYIVASSSLFKAAVAYAGMTDLLSFCGDAAAYSSPTSEQCEHGQGSLGGPWWDKWDAYLANSPLFKAADIRTPLLLVHGDKDDAVPFAQSVELFNTLRRMGNKPVALLQYEGEGHELERDAMRDLFFRMTGFFDHYLRGKPAPEWWAQAGG